MSNTESWQSVSQLVGKLLQKSWLLSRWNACNLSDDLSFHIQAGLEHLHRYFDYAMVGRSVPGSGRERGVLQWAVLQLASVHFRLGHMPLSLLALEEAVRLAQHASDHHCLAAALVRLSTPAHLSLCLRLYLHLCPIAYSRGHNLLANVIQQHRHSWTN